MKLKMALLALFATVLALGFSTQAKASTGSGNQWLSNYGYANAWNGGPYVYNYNASAVNNDFTLDPNGSTYYALVLTNHGAYAGQCVSDAFNQATDYLAALNPCAAGGTSSSTPWGANFTVTQCGGGLGIALYDVHWGKYLAPVGAGNGVQWQLNQSFSCLILKAPA